MTDEERLKLLEKLKKDKDIIIKYLEKNGKQYSNLKSNKKNNKR